MPLLECDLAMLILSRKPGESIIIDGGIRIVVLGSDAGAVRLGIEAPSSVGIVREEIVERIAEENRRAGTRPGDASLPEGLEPRLSPPGQDASEAD